MEGLDGLEVLVQDVSRAGVRGDLHEVSRLPGELNLVVADEVGVGVVVTNELDAVTDGDNRHVVLLDFRVRLVRPVDSSIVEAGSGCNSLQASEQTHNLKEGQGKRHSHLVGWECLLGAKGSGPSDSAWCSEFLPLNRPGR
jgi:hypothetical protein